MIITTQNSTIRIPVAAGVPDPVGNVTLTRQNKVITKPATKVNDYYVSCNVGDTPVGEYVVRYNGEECLCSIRPTAQSTSVQYSASTSAVDYNP